MPLFFDDLGVSFDLFLLGVVVATFGFSRYGPHYHVNKCDPVGRSLPLGSV